MIKEKCDVCHGKGKIVHRRYIIFKHIKETATFICFKCKGRGYVWKARKDDN